MSGHPIQGTIIRFLPEFEALTGISVIVDVLPEEDFFQKLHIDFESGQGEVDVFMTSPLYQWQYAQAGWIEDLSPYLDNPVLTDKQWFNPDDFFPVLWKASRWNGTIGGGLGQGALYSIPVWWEGSNLMYRKDLAATYGFVEPKTWDELYQQVTQISKRAKGKLHGFAGRGIRSWSQIHTYNLTMMASQGGRDLDPSTGKAEFNSPVGIEVGQYWIKMMRDAGTSKWPTYNWYEIAEEFQAGEYFAVMDANPFSIILEAKGSPSEGRWVTYCRHRGKKGRSPLYGCGHLG
ncbi:extracellular solute-binding protein [Vibrio sp. PP-XX7]